jgi:hypothetical protein
MALQNFVDKVGPAINAAWLNVVDAIKFTIFGDATTKAQARANLTSDAPYEVANGGTGQRTVTFTDVTQYANIQAAITAAGTNGAVLIPGTYAGTDNYTNPNGIPVLDLRALSNSISIWSVLAPALNVSSGGVGFPLGNDLVMRSYGPADLYLEKLWVGATTTTTLNVGANNNVPISAVTVANKIRPNVKTGTSALFAVGTGLGLTIGRGTANEEFVTSANWSIVDGTHLNITCAKTHTGTTDIEQIGIVDIIARQIRLLANKFTASQDSSNPQMQISDTNGVPYFYLPSDTSAAFPTGAIIVVPHMTGGNGANGDLVLRQSSVGALLRLKAFAGGDVFTVDNNGHAEFSAGVGMGAGTATLAGAIGETQTGRSSSSNPTSAADNFVLWQVAADPLNPGGIAGSLGLFARALAGAAINMIALTGGSYVVQLTADANGVTASNGLNLGQSSSAPALANNGTIATTNTPVSRVSPAGAVTGIILQAGVKAGQQCIVVNESANSITFAAAATSHVADGVSAVISAQRSMAFTWDTSTALWYHT